MPKINHNLRADNYLQEKKVPLFCHNVKKRRKKIGISQVELAHRIGVPQPRIAEIESGRFPEDPERIVLLAKALGVDINWLFGFSNED